MEKMHHMNFECVEPTETAKKQYAEFMFNPENAYHCDECPERGVSDNSNKYPCGQQNCWVCVHCEQNGI